MTIVLAYLVLCVPCTIGVIAVMMFDCEEVPEDFDI